MRRIAAPLAVALTLVAATARAQGGSAGSEPPILTLSAEAASPAAGIRHRRLAGVRPAVAALLAGGSEGGSLPSTLTFVPLEGEVPGVAAVIEVEGQALLAGVAGDSLSLELSAYLVDASGSLLGSAAGAFRVDLVAPNDAATVARSTVRIAQRVELDPRAASLRLALVCLDTGAFTLQRAALDPELVAQAPPGARIAADVSPSPSPSLAPTPPQTVDPRELEPLVASLRTAFGQLATGAREAAVQSVIDLELAVYRAAPDAAAERLARAAASAVRPILLHHREATLPVALLYQTVAARYVARGEDAAAFRADEQAALWLETAARLARAGAAKEKDPEALRAELRLVASALAGIAARHVERGGLTRGRSYVERAVKVDGEDPELLVALATLRTQGRDRDAARALLDRALAVEPGHREARLRRALLGGGGESDRELAAIASDLAANDWVGRLAAQEEVRRLLARGEPQAAERLAGERLRRYPDDATLHIVRGFALSRTGRRQGAADEVERVLATPPGRGATPRHRFVVGAPALLVARRSEAELAASLRLGELRQALAGDGANRGDTESRR